MASGGITKARCVKERALRATGSAWRAGAMAASCSQPLMQITSTHQTSSQSAASGGTRASRQRRRAARLSAAIALLCAGGLGAAEDTPEASSGSGDWYCVGYDAGHSYTSPDTVTTPLKFKWCWQPPAEEHVELMQVVSSNGKVFAHGRHINSTPVGQRNCAHNWEINLETGALVKEDPSGTYAQRHPRGLFRGQLRRRRLPVRRRRAALRRLRHLESGADPPPPDHYWAIVQHHAHRRPAAGHPLRQDRRGDRIGMAALHQRRPREWQQRRDCEGDVAIARRQSSSRRRAGSPRGRSSRTDSAATSSPAASGIGRSMGNSSRYRPAPTGCWRSMSAG